MIDIFEYPFIYRELNKYLTDEDKFNIILLNKFINFKRSYFFFDKLVEYSDELQNKWYYNNLKNIKIETLVTFPQNLKYLEINFRNFNQEDVLKFETLIPKSLEHINIRNCKFNFNIPFDMKLTIDYLTNKINLDHISDIKTNIISKKLKSFGRPKKLEILVTTKSLKLTIPDSVEFLKLSKVYKLKRNIIPNSVKILTIDTWGISNFKNKIPNSVENLDIFVGFSNYSQEVKINLPNSIKKLKIGGVLNVTIPESVVNLTIYNLDELESFKMFSVTNLALIGCYDSLKSHYKIPDCVVELTINLCSLDFILDFNNVKFLKTKKSYYEHFKNSISDNVEIILLN